ncbi:helix-turn-helix transcriptional regulator [Nitratireductor pacificus]|nr:helix-turn-helix transcriptional regulator [Nitratireductor pacificus]
MTAEIRERTATPRRKAATRRDLSGLARRSCRAAGAAFYLIADTAPGSASGALRILVSNWSFDTIEDVGAGAIGRLLESPVSTFPGTAPSAWHPLTLAAMLASDDVARLCRHDHQEMFLLKLPAGKGRFVALVSATTTGRVDTQQLARAQMALCHMLSGLENEKAASGELLSERERECLLWVSEGKTADEVSLILNVSSNTVNSYVAHAIHKLSAKNRAMAIATAIRRGII